MAILARSSTFRHHFELLVDSSKMLECTLVNCRRLACSNSRLQSLQTRVYFPQSESSFVREASLNSPYFLRLRRCKSAIIQGLLRGRTVKVRMGMCLRMHSQSFSFLTDQVILTMSVPDIASIKGVMFRVSQRPCQSA